MEKDRFEQFQDSLNHFLEILDPLTDPEYNNWYALTDSEKDFNEFLAEVRESHAEFLSGEYSQLEWELGDVVMDLFCLICKLEDEGRIDASNVLEKVRAKMDRRKPHLLKRQKISKQEEIRLWNEAKRAEGYPEERLWSQKREETGNT